jgi:hypothetical protein
MNEHLQNGPKIISKSIGKSKAQIVIHELGPNGRILTRTVHLLFKGGKWRDNDGTEYSL